MRVSLLALEYAWDELPVHLYINSQIKLWQKLKHSAGLRPQDLIVRPVHVVLGRVEGAGYMVPVTHFHCWGLEVITTPPKPGNVFQVPCTDMFSMMWVFLNHGDRRETGNRLLSWILRVCFIIQDPPEARLKCWRGSGWATPWPLRSMRLETSAPRRTSTGPGTPKSQSARQSPVRCFQRGWNVTGYVGKGGVTLGSTNASIPQCLWGHLLSSLQCNPESPKETVCDEGSCRALPIPAICTCQLLWGSRRCVPSAS